MAIRPTIAFPAGAILVAVLAIGFAARSDEVFSDRLAKEAEATIAEAGGRGVSALFRTPRNDWPTRHPLLGGGEALNEKVRDSVAKAVGSVPGVGGIRWTDGTMVAEAGEMQFSPTHCQDDVNALLRARTIRFEESSSQIDPGSRELIGEVAAALRPCLGAIISITGHTDASGPEAGNIALSSERAQAIRQALIARGIPRDGLRSMGVGSREPVEGLAKNDPANRRIEFAVIATTPLAPTPVDTPGAR